MKQDLAVTAMKQKSQLTSINLKQATLEQKVTSLETKMVAMDSKLDTILALLTADVKKREKIVEDKCRPSQSNKKDDTTDGCDGNQSSSDVVSAQSQLALAVTKTKQSSSGQPSKSSQSSEFTKSQTLTAQTLTIPS